MAPRYWAVGIAHGWWYMHICHCTFFDECSGYLLVFLRLILNPNGILCTVGVAVGQSA